MKPVISARIAAAGIALALFGCGGPPNSLDGSISESFSLDFDRVDILKQGITLRVEYLKDIAGTTNKVCKVIIETESLNIKKDSTIKGDLFKQQVTIERVANTGGNFPEVNQGELHFDEYKLEGGGRIDGNFDVGFKNGRTLSGNFDGTVQEISLE